MSCSKLSFNGDMQTWNMLERKKWLMHDPGRNRWEIALCDIRAEGLLYEDIDGESSTPRSSSLTSVAKYSPLNLKVG